MLRELRPALSVLAVMIILTGLIYPLVTTALAQVLFPWQANGSMLSDGYGSALIGQSFSAPRYFWSRQSATVPFAYNAVASGGSNLGPLNEQLLANVQTRIDGLRAADAAMHVKNPAPLPVDLVTASASGLDPHISPAAAEYQVARVAAARGIEESTVRDLIAQHTLGRQFGILGEPRVNVLELNLALDAMSP